MAKVLVSEGKIVKGTKAYENMHVSLPTLKPINQRSTIYNENTTFNKLAYRVFGVSSRGIECRDIIVPFISKSTKKNSLDADIDNMIFAAWSAQNVAKTLYNYNRVNDCILMGWA